MLRRRKHSGIGLLELMLSLVVIAALLLLVTRYYLITERAERVSKGAEMINNIVDASVKYSEGLTNTSQGMSLQSLIDTRLLSDSYSRSPWARSQDDITILPIKNGFRIIIANVPMKECNNLLQLLANKHPNIEQKCDNRGKYAGYSLLYYINTD
ncbi:MAG: hypothetical protein KAS93_03405 [Gammaproteobacteria bacterium]|nr:hypothetical protein [Gammaproteobacteria bacterium]